MAMVNALDIGPFDLVVLDMAIPSHPTAPGEGSPVSFLTGGLDVLLELSARNPSSRCMLILSFRRLKFLSLLSCFASDRSNQKSN